MSGHRCIFCNQIPEAWSEEHISPEWLLEYLGITKQTPLRQGYSGDKELSREFGAYGFVEGRVCKSCNTGWMSRLENSVRPILPNLLDGSKNLAELSPAESAIVAKWATKTCYVLANASLAGKPVPAEHLQELNKDNGTIPQRVGVFALQAVYDAPMSFLQIQFWPQIIAQGQSAVDPYTLDTNAYKIVIQYKHLILMVAHWPHQPGQLTLAAGWHVPIWPPKLIWPSYVKQRDVPPLSSLPIMRSFAEALAVWAMPETAGNRESDATT